jgi:preprotein translocase subunit SecD
MTRYPIWKAFLILASILLAVVYSLPNLFGELPALQISPGRQQQALAPDTLSRVQHILSSQGISIQSIHRDGERIEAIFKDTEQQIKAKSVVQEFLGQNYVTALNLIPAAPDWLKALGAHPMFLGLDLRGGVHFLLEVDLDSAIEKTLNRDGQELRRSLRSLSIRPIDFKIDKKSITLQLENKKDLDKFNVLLNQSYPLLSPHRSNETPLNIRLSLKEDGIVQIGQDAVKQNITTLSNRINELGVAEPIIQQSGDRRIVVQLPGVQDTAKAKDILGRTATLEVRMVAESEGIGTEVLQERTPNGQWQPIIVNKTVELTGENIQDAQAGFDDQKNIPAVFLKFDAHGTRVFRDLTANNIGKRLAMILVENGVSEVITAPVLQTEIADGRPMISGSMKVSEAQDIALLLRAGALAAPMKIIEESTVGPSLGKDNITQGFRSTWWGFLAIILFMVFYYRVFGVVSSIALGVNLLLLLALLSLLQATLTLPGIAAIALTLGMAIDANVLINERIREELRRGLSPAAAIQEGYGHAWATILDSNITTFIAGVALFIFGSGPIRGFAVVHCLGIMTSIFSAVLVSRFLVHLWYGRHKRLHKVAI